ncbi:MAG: DUF2829 domain-containing protein [Spirochaetaceae bacterium]|jgi:hypothetical protein|nr:DUF2829 domain-containing protein [Spirochaetaceae bacterium]
MVCCENGHCEIPNNDLGFEKALAFLKAGRKVAMSGWNGKDMWLGYCKGSPDADVPCLPYVYIEYPIGHPVYPKGCYVPWLASQTDILSDDWFIVD